MTSLVEEGYGLRTGHLQNKPSPPTISIHAENQGMAGDKGKPNFSGTEKSSELECGNQETMWSSIFTFAVLLV